MKKKLLSVSLLALALCGTGVLAHAQDEVAAPPAGHGTGGHGEWGPGGFGPGGFGPMSHDLNLRELNLTDAQKQQIHTLMQAQHAAMKPLMQQLEQNRAALLTATAGGAFDAAKIQTLASQKAALDAQLEVKRQQLLSQVYNTVLTSEQKATAETLRQKELTRINEHLQSASEPPPAE
jgi:Spy/CpxP family protein refolding chaperone